MAIQPKHKPVIKKGNGYVYNPATFVTEHKVPFFYDVEPEEVLKRLKPYEYAPGHKVIWFDTETHPYYKCSQDVPKQVVRRWVGKGKTATPQDFPFCMSFSDGLAAYVVYDTFDTSGKNAYTNYNTIRDSFRKFKKLAPLFEDPDIEKCAHNAKFDMHMIANVGLKIIGRIHDTVVLAKLTNENRMSFQLLDLAKYLHGNIIKFEYMVDAYKQMNKVHDYRMIPRELMTQYTCADTWNDSLVFKNEYVKLAPDDLEDLYENELQLMVVLYAMERYGMPVIPEYEKPLKAELQKVTDEAEAAIYEEAGKMFNINSGKQLYEVFMSLGVNKDWISFTDKGNPTLDKDALNNLAEVHDVSIVKKILEFRQNEKLLNTYAVGIYEQRDSEDRVHGNINQTEATTGRMSITKPALQTLPKKDKRIRSAFIPEEGDKLWFLDLDQVEYRLFGHYSKSRELLEAIRNGYDVHAATAAIIFHVSLDELVDGMKEQEDLKTKVKSTTDPGQKKIMEDRINFLQKYVDMRAKGKTINFAMIYGVGIGHLQELLKCSESEAVELKMTYFRGLPEAKPFIQTVEYVIKARGYVKNWYGRRRRLDADDCYKAPNALIQGCAADYIKHKMVLMFKYLMYHELKTKMLNVVHDENIIDCPPEEEYIMPELRWLQSDFDTFRCPITAGTEYGEHDWGHKTEVDIGFKEPEDKSFMTYNIYNGKVFDIYREMTIA
jgi:DNA polymerase I